MNKLYSTILHTMVVPIRYCFGRVYAQIRTNPYLKEGCLVVCLFVLFCLSCWDLLDGASPIGVLCTIGKLLAKRDASVWFCCIPTYNVKVIEFQSYL